MTATDDDPAALSPERVALRTLLVWIVAAAAILLVPAAFFDRHREDQLPWWLGAWLRRPGPWFFAGVAFAAFLFVALEECAADLPPRGRVALLAGLALLLPVRRTVAAQWLVLLERGGKDTAARRLLAADPRALLPALQFGVVLSLHYASQALARTSRRRRTTVSPGVLAGAVLFHGLLVEGLRPGRWCFRFSDTLAACPPPPRGTYLAVFAGTGLLLVLGLALADRVAPSRVLPDELAVPTARACEVAVLALTVTLLLVLIVSGVA